MSTVVKDLGAATAYGYAVEKGYTGTEAEFAELMASYAIVGQTAVTAAQTATTKASEAATSATTATNKASEATTAATTATAKAGEASTSASTATSAKDTAVSASQTATTKATEATTAAATATSAATTATTAKDDAVSAKTAAQTAQTGAETAAASVSASAAQIQENTDDIDQLKKVESDIYSSEIVRKYDTSISYDGNVTLTSGNTYIRLIPTVVKRGYIELYSYKPTETPYRAYVLDLNYKVKKIVSCKTAVATRIRIDEDGYIAIGGNTNSWWLAQFTISDVGDTTYESTSFSFATPNGSENVTVGTSLGTPVEIGQKGAYLVRITQYETYFDRSMPVVITVGTGKDYTDLKEAVDYANTLSGERIVEVYEGVYDVYANITQDEINDAQYEGGASHFVGLRISDGMTLRGIGDKRNIIINGALSTSYSQDVRSAISTLNLLGNCTVENVTVTSDAIRYPVHDDYRANANAVHKVKNCIFRSISGVYGAIPDSYGLGGRSGLKLEIDFCEFFPSVGYHTNNGFELPCCVQFKNCTIDGKLVLNDYTSSVVNSVELINTTCVSISFSAQSGNTKQSIAIVVRGKSIPIINNASYEVLYDSSDVLKGRAYDTLTKGAPARIRDNYQIQKFNADTSPILYQGVVLKDVAYTGIAMIQCHGWIETSFFPSLTLAVGDKIGVVNGAFAIVQSDEVGVVKRDGLVWLY